MTKIQKVICVFMTVCFGAVLCILPNPSGIKENLYRQLPFYCFLENRSGKYPMRDDMWTSNQIIIGNAEYMSEEVMSENVRVEIEEQVETVLPEVIEEQVETVLPKVIEEQVETVLPEVIEEQVETVLPNIKEKQAELLPCPVLDLSLERLEDFDYLLGNFFIVDSSTSADAVDLNAAEFLNKNLSIEKEKNVPQILIYHSHSQEAFADSREGKVEDTIVGVGAYLAEILENVYGYQVIHVTEEFDLAEGILDRSSAYDYARAYVEKVLEEHPSIEVVIDLHRDGVAENRRLVTEINGKDTAQIMFYNGLSYTNSYGKVDYLPNPYIQDNLAFSFQLEYQAALYYPDFYRGIYLAGLRYNLHLRPRALLLEAGAQTNTVQEVKNAMEPFADILNRVLE